MNIIYEDSHILVCYKEAGLPVQSAAIGTKDLVSVLKTYLWEQSGGKKEPYLGVIHRLDQPVEGVLAFAKTRQAAKDLSAQVTDGRMKKIYQAVVFRRKADIPQEGHLVDYLIKDGKTNRSRVVPEGTLGAKRAQLDYRMIRISGETGPALVRICLLTGRHHQIRVQMAHAGMPLCGDQKYGNMAGDCFREEHDLKQETMGKRGAADGRSSLALCAVSLYLYHPKTGKQMEFSCSPQGEYFNLFGTY